MHLILLPYISVDTVFFIRWYAITFGYIPKNSVCSPVI